MTTKSKIEIWKDVVGQEGVYQVSNQNRAKSLARFRTYMNRKTRKIESRRVPEKILNLGEDKDGYYIVNIPKNKGGIGHSILHRLIAKAFVPNPENKPCVNHKDGNKKNNKPYNLEWVTVKENTRHAVKNSLHANMRGGKKVRPDDVPIILTRLARGDCRNQIAKDYNIGVDQICGIRAGKTWKTIVEEWKKINGDISRLTWKKKNGK